MSWLTYLSMPLLAAFIGYTTKLVAIEMMFRPIEFVGKPPLLGWQGIIPRHAGRMGSISMSLLLGRLIDVNQILGRLDPKALGEHLREPMTKAVTEIGTELMAKYQPQLWEMLPEEAQRRILAQIAARAPKAVEELIADLSRNPDAYLDVWDMALRNLIADRGALNRLFRDIGAPELKFIARSGLYFGLVIGLLQAGVWALTHNPLVMPVFGAIVGLTTDWIALKMIFFPREERRYLGIRWQGMFQRRRHEVMGDYAKMVADEVLTVPAMMDALLTGPKSDRLIGLVQRHVSEVVDRQVGVARPLVMLSIGTRRYQEFKDEVVARAIATAPSTMAPVMAYAKDALAIEQTIVGAMRAMTPLEFESVLRPAFKQDEWKLILVGGILGAIVGELQVLLLIGH
ncbi:DUF445 domain-containing protein [Pseudonocardia spinosispora]|uniref:DUF445 domain-containing protein n=1 Tax=Pseudonocardia spinosispora TaxID=103441 RepID=UPI00040FAF01|nr:hypothetical protein [Pseudonocardia spinosispora]